MGIRREGLFLGILLLRKEILVLEQENEIAYLLKVVWLDFTISESIVVHNLSHSQWIPACGGRDIVYSQFA